MNDITVIEENKHETKMANETGRYDNNTCESPDITIKVDLINYDESKEIGQETVRTDVTVA